MTMDKTFERIEKLFDVQAFKDQGVLILGCGSGGSSVALQLAMSGVQKMTLVDMDTLGPENVIRHICGRRFIGQKKTDAVAEVLLDRNPNIQIEKIEADIMKYLGLEELVKRNSVIVLATDNEPTRYKVNEMCVKLGKAFVVGKVFTRGIGGEVFCFRPGESGCLACLESILQRTQYRTGIKEIELVSDEEREKVYGMEIAEIKDSPGLTVDISFITAFHARFVLDAIARNLNERPKYLAPIEENYLIWGNRPVAPFTKNFQIQRISVSPQDGCAVCGTGATE
jgi:molybdopterin/thiamine biosynthesis adenylyltransferase